MTQLAWDGNVDRRIFHFRSSLTPSLTASCWVVQAAGRPKRPRILLIDFGRRDHNYLHLVGCD